MGNRGKISASALAIVPPTYDAVPRLSPPADLTDEEVEEWVRIVNCEPADKFAPSHMPLLTQLCRHVIQSRRYWELRERYWSNKNSTIEDLDKISRMIARESSALAVLATKLCLSPKSITNHRGNKKPIPARPLHE